MSRLETTRSDLKHLASSNIEQAFKEAKQLISPDSAAFDTILLLQGQYKKCREEFLLGMLSPEQNTQVFARILMAFLQMIDHLSPHDLAAEKETARKPGDKRGELLYHIPHNMQVMKESKCTVRIAWTEQALFEGWLRRNDDTRRHNLRVAELMGVELLCSSEEAPFAIRTLNSTVQFFDEEDYTEWIFYVKPLEMGHYPLLLRISVIEMRDNREVKREMILEEQVVVSAETAELATINTLVKAPLDGFFIGRQTETTTTTKHLKLYGALLVVFFAGLMTLFLPQNNQVEHTIVGAWPLPEDSLALPVLQSEKRNERMAELQPKADDQSRRMAAAEQARAEKYKTNGQSGGVSGSASGQTGRNPFGKSPGMDGGGTAAGNGPAQPEINTGGALTGRGIVFRPRLAADSSIANEGRVRVKICVGKKGEVVSLEPVNAGSTTTDSLLRIRSLIAARSFRFVPDSSAELQCGWVDFDYKQKEE